MDSFQKTRPWRGLPGEAAPAEPRKVVADYLRLRTLTPQLVPSLAALAGSIASQVKAHGSLARVPAEAVANVRNDMYPAAQAIRLLDKNPPPNLDPTHART